MKIQHVYDTSGNHCIEITDDNGVVTRGDFAGYEAIASHPDGYVAVTDYYAGSDEFNHGKDGVPDGGCVWKILPVQWEIKQTMSEADSQAAIDQQLSPKAYEMFREANKKYLAETPRHPALVDWAKMHDHNQEDMDSDEHASI